MIISNQEDKLGLDQRKRNEKFNNNPKRIP